MPMLSPRGALIAACLAALVGSCSSREDSGPGNALAGSSNAGSAGSGVNHAGASGSTTSGGKANGGGAGRVGAGLGGSASAGAPDEASATAGAPATSSSACDAPGLVWKSANKTNYESYPDPGSAECVEFNGCTWEGQFAACDGKKPESWVMTHDIVAAFPDFDALALHDLCLRKGDKTIVVTVLDTCGDSDCDGCCTENRGNADQLIDVEKYTSQRWGVPDGRIEWADLGPTRGGGCD